MDSRRRRCVRSVKQGDGAVRSVLNPSSKVAKPFKRPSEDRALEPNSLGVFAVLTGHSSMAFAAC